MSHADKTHDPISLNHDPTAKIPSKSSQPPIRVTMVSESLWDYDRRVFLAKKYRTQIASGPASFLSVLAGAPMENIKTRMQSKHFPNAIDCVRYTFKTEGIRGFWAGTTAPLLSITFSRVASFSVYQKAKYSIDAAMEKSLGVSPLGTVNTPGTYPDIYTVGCFTTSGAIAGASIAVLLSPFELVKNAAQTSVLMASENLPRGAEPGSAQLKNYGRVTTFSACKQIIERRGFLGLWTGFRLHLLRDTVGSGIYFGVYEAVKQAFTSYRGEEKANTAPAVATAGILCGIMSWVATYPLDTMKTRAQNRIIGNPAPRPPHQPHSLKYSPVEVLSSMANASGKSPTALETAARQAAKAARASKWKGVEMIILRSSIQNMIQMCIFEGIKTQIIGMKFSNGKTDPPMVRRERGRDKRVV